MPDIHPQPADLSSWLTYLEKLHPKSIALGLERVNQVRLRMGLNPEFITITVAGTNGKGSTCAMLESILLAEGYHVGCYTSPHLLNYNERVRVDCLNVSDKELCRAFSAVEAVRGDIPLTYFEFGTLAAFWHFAKVGIKVAVLEVGLGGRLDAVNAVDADCAVITSIDIDHMDYLGNTRESIGKEKAGVFRHAVPAICGDIAPPATVTVHAKKIDAAYRQIGVDFGYEQHVQDWNFWTNHDCGSQLICHLPFPALTGAFQFCNAACALEALFSIRERLPVSEESIRQGLAQVSLSGRFQRLQQRPEIIVDVAHNPQAARSLAENLRQQPCLGRTLAVFAMLSDKDIAGVVSALGEEMDAWYVAGIDAPRGASFHYLSELLLRELPNAQITLHTNTSEALDQACRSATENDRIVVFGSFYTVADALRAFALPHTFDRL